MSGTFKFYSVTNSLIGKLRLESVLDVSRKQTKRLPEGCASVSGSGIIARPIDKHSYDVIVV